MNARVKRFVSWAVYFDARDYRGVYAVRQFVIVGGDAVPTHQVEIFDTLEEARASVPAGLHCETRQAHEHPSVVEVWF